jgi:hypothetical protein
MFAKSAIREHVTNGFDRASSETRTASPIVIAGVNKLVGYLVPLKWLKTASTTCLLMLRFPLAVARLKAGNL